jgi:hypothetical protein
MIDAVSPGELIRADAWNDLRGDVAELQRSQVAADSAPALRADTNFSTIWVRNDYAFRIERFWPIGLDQLVADPDTGAAATAQHEERAVFSGTKPSPRHVQNYAILEQPLEPCEVGRAVISGAVAVRFIPARDRDYDLRPYRHGNVGRPLAASDHAANVGLDSVGTLLWNDLEISAAQYRILGASSAGDGSVVAAGFGGAVGPHVGTWYGGPAQAALHWGQSHWVPAACGSGSSSFVCSGGRYQLSSSTCPDGCDAFRVIEYAASHYHLHGVAYKGLDFPCVDGAVVSGLVCSAVDGFVKFGVANFGPPIPPNETAFAVSSGENCLLIQSCVYECQDAGGGDWNWVLTQDCGANCRCQALDTDIYQCGAATCPRQVTSNCRNTTTSTTTSNPPPTTTTAAPCGGPCVWQCVDDGGGFVVSQVSNTCINGCECAAADLFGPVQAPCGPVTCGDFAYTTCFNTPAPTTTAPPTSTTANPVAGCSGPCRRICRTWSCGPFGELVCGGWAGLDYSCNSNQCCECDFSTVPAPNDCNELFHDSTFWDGVCGVPTTTTTTTAAPTTTTTAAPTTTTTAAPTTTTTAAPTTTTTAAPSTTTTAAPTTTTTAAPTTTTTAAPTTTTTAAPSSTTTRLRVRRRQRLRVRRRQRLRVRRRQRLRVRRRQRLRVRRRQRLRVRRRQRLRVRRRQRLRVRRRQRLRVRRRQRLRVRRRQRLRVRRRQRLRRTAGVGALAGLVARGISIRRGVPATERTGRFRRPAVVRAKVTRKQRAARCPVTAGRAGRCGRGMVPRGIYSRAETVRAVMSTATRLALAAGVRGRRRWWSVCRFDLRGPAEVVVFWRRCADFRPMRGRAALHCCNLAGRSSAAGVHERGLYGGVSG